MNSSLTQDDIFMQEAIKEAKRAYIKGEVPVGCVIVFENKIIARAHNLRHTKKNVLNHAEIIALNKACLKLERWILDDVTIYITLEPCLMCIGALLQARVKRVVYGAREPKFGCLGSVINVNDFPFNHKIEVVCGINGEEISDIMKNFFKERR